MTMDTADRIEKLEQQVRILEHEIAQTLKELQANLPEKSTASRRWQKNAWMLALLNLLMAVVLFTNIYLYLPNAADWLNLSPMVYAGLHALWIVIAFVWLLLQMYPLALLLEQDDAQWQGMVWRNASAFFCAKPTWLILVTFVVLVIALINTVIPAAWLIIAVALLVAFASIALRNLIDLVRQRSQIQDRG